jgi:hypothetical protein
MLEDPRIQAYMTADPALREAWNSEGVQGHFRRILEMHGAGGDHGAHDSGAAAPTGGHQH